MSKKMAPMGFTKTLWKNFDRDGLLILPKRLSLSEVKDLSSALEKISKDSGTFQTMNLPNEDIRFLKMVCNKKHIGYLYDVFGDSLKLVFSQGFIRHPHEIFRNDWHFDGPRIVPFQTFGKKLPFRIKVGFWLSKLDKPFQGNLVYIPGSHRRPFYKNYKTHNFDSNQKSLLIEPGQITLMWSGLWHRVEENNGPRVRKNFFFEYGPSWLQNSDRYTMDSKWRTLMSREEKIVLRDFDHPNYSYKPKDEDACIFRPRKGEPSGYLESQNKIPLGIRRRFTWVERKIYGNK